MKAIQVRSKIWLEVDGAPFLGDGRYRLLRAIERNGSINAVARELGGSYRKAWAQLAVMEDHAPFPLLERRTGGKAGGATVLTEEILRLLAAYSLTVFAGSASQPPLEEAAKSFEKKTGTPVILRLGGSGAMLS